MVYHYVPMSVYVRSKDYGTPVECEYDPIRIKWDSGFMDVVPPALFTEANLSKIRKVFKLAAMSDLQFNTNTISAWHSAFKAERDYQFKVLSEIQNQYDTAYIEIVESAKEQDGKRGKKINDLQKRRKWAIKQLDSRRKKIQKCIEILEEIAERYKGGTDHD